MALCKKFDEIYEYGKLLREKGGALTRQIFKGAVKIVEVKKPKKARVFTNLSKFDPKVQKFSPQIISKFD